MLREPEYYAKQANGAGASSSTCSATAWRCSWPIGATFGALNCMYSAIASRQVEIATLRAIGFGGAPVVVSVMIEALVLALVGGAVGGGLAYALLRRRLALHAQLQHVLAGRLRLPRDARPARPGPDRGRS